MNRRRFLQKSFHLAGGALVGNSLFFGCRSESLGDRVRVRYWEKWGGDEAPAMRAVVDAFNASQDRIFVDYLSVSQIDRKTTISIAGGDPPDLAGIWSANIAAFADRAALHPLGQFMKQDGTVPAEWMNRYTPSAKKLCLHDNEVYALPTTPSASALHWNKTLFRQAGLDPEKPPVTLTELDRMAAELTRREPKTGRLLQVGFLPQEPGFWPWAFPLWFGGAYLDGSGAVVTAKDPANLAALEWIRSYTDRYGLDATRRFASGVGGANTPQSAFMNGKVAMVLQGVWMNNLISLYAPGLDYGVAAWPHVQGTDSAPFTVVEADVAVICRGARHAQEAWEFLKFLSRNNALASSRRELEGLETLCYMQEKHSPLNEWSPYFSASHPHPFIHDFRSLSLSRRATSAPRVGLWDEFSREINNAVTSVGLLASTPRDALAYAHKRMERSWDRYRRSMERQQPHTTNLV